jgi:16S rRNA (cytosine967-C5)-methyltransferase
LLERMARHVYPGGALVYAVCSTDPRETTEVIDGFLARENFERGLIPAAYERFMTDAGDVLVPPGLNGRDGFYIARVERRA